MKKIVFFAYSLDTGGIERALISLLKELDYQLYEVTLILERKEGAFLNEIPFQVKIVEYRISTSKFTPLRKIKNRLKIAKMIAINHNKFDFACCYVPYSIPGSILTRYLSKNNSIWIHSDYYYLYNKDKNKITKFFNDRNISSFKHIIFVAEEAKNNFEKIYPELKDKVCTCNNLIDYKDIIKKEKSNVLQKKPKCPLFVNIARHQEHAKKITRLINASVILKTAGYDFEVWLIGSGEDSKLYEDLIKKYDISDKVKMFGTQKNPYPYLKMADTFILTSDYEGFPVVYLESLILNKPIITTIDIAIDGLSIKDNYGLVANKNEKDIALKMKQFIENGYKIKNPFDFQKYNDNINNKIIKMINNDWWI